MEVFLVLFLLASCQGRLQLVNSGPGELMAREGANQTLECRTTTRWFLCVWRGPGGLALHLGEGDNMDSTHNGHRISAWSRNTVCRLQIHDMRRSEAGQYRCVLADRDKVETVDRQFQLGVGFPVQTVGFQGPGVMPGVAGASPTIAFEPGNELELACMVEGGNPPPRLDIHTRANITFQVNSGSFCGFFVSPFSCRQLLRFRQSQGREEFAL